MYEDMRANPRTGASMPSGTSSNTPGTSYTKVQHTYLTHLSIEKSRLCAFH